MVSKAQAGYDAEVSKARILQLTQLQEKTTNRLKLYQAHLGYGLEIIVASRSFDSIASSFGHIAIRFVGSGSHFKDDLVVSFEMLTVDPSKEISYGFRGGYEVNAVAYSFLEYMKTYQVEQGREFQRVILPSTQEQRQNILDVMLSILKVPDLYGDYKFFGNNCATLIMKVLKSSGFPVFKIGILDRPMTIDNSLNFLKLAPYKPITMPSAATILFSYLEKYKNREQGRVQRFFNKKVDREDLVKALAEKNFWIYLRDQLSEYEKHFLALFWPTTFIREAIRRSFAKEESKSNRLEVQRYLETIRYFHFIDTTTKSIDEVLDASLSTDSSLYQICLSHDQACLDERYIAVSSDTTLLNGVVERTRWWRVTLQQEVERSKQLSRRDIEDRTRDWASHPNVEDLLGFTEALGRE